MNVDIPYRRFHYEFFSLDIPTRIKILSYLNLIKHEDFGHNPYVNEPYLRIVERAINERKLDVLAVMTNHEYRNNRNIIPKVEIQQCDRTSVYKYS